MQSQQLNAEEFHARLRSMGLNSEQMERVFDRIFCGEIVPNPGWHYLDNDALMTRLLGRIPVLAFERSSGDIEGHSLLGGTAGTNTHPARTVGMCTKQKHYYESILEAKLQGMGLPGVHAEYGTDYRRLVKCANRFPTSEAFLAHYKTYECHPDDGSN